MSVPRARIKAEVQRLLAQPHGSDRPVPVEDLAWLEGIAVVLQPMDDGEDISGFYMRNGAERVIGVNASHPAVRQRFTIAHELGHALLERRDGMHIDSAFRLRDAASSQAVDPEEIAANAFAAELLMPEGEVREAVSAGIDMLDDEGVRQIRELARKFGVSQQAIMYRLVNLNLAFDGKAVF